MRTPAYNIFYAMQTSQLCIDGQQIIYKGVLNLGGHVHICTLGIKKLIISPIIPKVFH